MILKKVRMNLLKRSHQIRYKEQYAFTQERRQEFCKGWDFYLSTFYRPHGDDRKYR